MVTPGDGIIVFLGGALPIIRQATKRTTEVPHKEIIQRLGLHAVVLLLLFVAVVSHYALVFHWPSRALLFGYAVLMLYGYQRNTGRVTWLDTLFNAIFPVGLFILFYVLDIPAVGAGGGL